MAPDLSPALGGGPQERRRRIRDAVGRAAARLLGPDWWPSCGLCSWRARFWVTASADGIWSHGYACDEHLPRMVGYSTDQGHACQVEPARRAGGDAGEAQASASSS